MEDGNVFGEDRGCIESSKHFVCGVGTLRFCKASSGMVQIENENFG